MIIDNYVYDHRVFKEEFMLKIKIKFTFFSISFVFCSLLVRIVQ